MDDYCVRAMGIGGITRERDEYTGRRQRLADDRVEGATAAEEHWSPRSGGHGERFPAARYSTMVAWPTTAANTRRRPKTSSYTRRVLKQKLLNDVVIILNFPSIPSSFFLLARTTIIIRCATIMTILFTTMDADFGVIGGVQ